MNASYKYTSISLHIWVYTENTCRKPRVNPFLCPTNDLIYNLIFFSFPTDLALLKYEVIVYTGDVFGAGTNANVTIMIFGEHGDSGKRSLQQSFRDLFERNQVDKFQMDILDLGIIFIHLIKKFKNFYL